MTRPCKINGQTESRELYRHQFHVLPAVVLWNPYDIRIEPSDFVVFSGVILFLTMVAATQSVLAIG